MVDPLELNALGLSVGQLAGAIEASDGRRTAGEVVTQGHRLTVGLSGEFDALDELLANLPDILAGRICRCSYGAGPAYRCVG